MDISSAPRVLVIGLDPYRVPGPWDPTPVADGIKLGMSRFAAHGIPVESCLIPLDGSADPEAMMTTALTAHPWECVVVGGGIRKSEDRLDLFEQVINLVHRHAPTASIAFSTTPSDTYTAAARRLNPSN